MTHNRECRHVHGDWEHIYDETFQNRTLLVPTEEIRATFIDLLAMMSRIFDVDIACPAFTPVGYGFLARFPKKNRHNAMQWFKSQMTRRVNAIYGDREGTIYRTRYREAKTLDAGALLTRAVELRLAPVRLGFTTDPDDWWDPTDELAAEGARIVDPAELTGRTAAELDALTRLRLDLFLASDPAEHDQKRPFPSDVKDLEKSLTEPGRWPVRYGDGLEVDGLVVNRFGEATSEAKARAYEAFREALGRTYWENTAAWEADYPMIWPDDTIPRGRTEVSQRPRGLPRGVREPRVPTVRALWASVARPPPGKAA